MLRIGDLTATDGMTKAIYDQLESVMKPDLGELKPEELEKIRKSWRKLAFAISKGVIEHITANMEVFGVQTRGNVSTTVQGNTGAANPANHQHSVNLSGTQNNVTFTQSNDGTGRVR